MTDEVARHEDGREISVVSSHFFHYGINHSIWYIAVQATEISWLVSLDIHVSIHAVLVG